MVRSILAVAALGAALALSGCNTAYNYFEDEPDPNAAPTPTTAFGALIGDRLTKQSGPIDPGPRAPLAIPGSTDLPPPGSGSAARAAMNFPEDHDARRRREGRERREAAERLDDIAAERGRFLPGDVPDANGVETRTPDSMKDLTTGPEVRLNRQEMQVTIRGRGENVVLTDDGKAAPRQALIVPPTDYRTPAETAALPDAGDVENSEWIKKQLYRKEVDPGARHIKE